MTWTPELLEKADQLQRGGMSYLKVAKHLGKPPRGTEMAIRRFRDRQHSGNFYLGYLDGPPIGDCKVENKLAEDAIIGSDLLRIAIIRAGVRP